MQTPVYHKTNFFFKHSSFCKVQPMRCSVTCRGCLCDALPFLTAVSNIYDNHVWYCFKLFFFSWKHGAVLSSRSFIKFSSASALYGEISSGWIVSIMHPGKDILRCPRAGRRRHCACFKADSRDVLQCSHLQSCWREGWRAGSKPLLQMMYPKQV